MSTIEELWQTAYDKYKQMQGRKYLPENDTVFYGSICAMFERGVNNPFKDGDNRIRFNSAMRDYGSYKNSGFKRPCKIKTMCMQIMLIMDSIDYNPFVESSVEEVKENEIVVESKFSMEEPTEIKPEIKVDEEIINEDNAAERFFAIIDGDKDDIEEKKKAENKAAYNKKFNSKTKR